jgi:signal transduction histidine kinase
VVDQLIRELVTGSEASDARVERQELPRVWGDEHLLAQLLQNLIGNDLKFRGEAAPLIRIEARRDTDRWQVRVSDNGIGIDPRFHQQVFEPLRRLHPASSYEGYGLGLYASKRIVERHGGRIWLESKPGEGTTLCLTLPGADDARSQASERG